MTQAPGRTSFADRHRPAPPGWGRNNQGSSGRAHFLCRFHAAPPPQSPFWLSVPLETGLQEDGSASASCFVCPRPFLAWARGHSSFCLS